jgi:hypothetical protein
MDGTGSKTDPYIIKTFDDFLEIEDICDISLDDIEPRTQIYKYFEFRVDNDENLLDENDSASLKYTGFDSSRKGLYLGFKSQNLSQSSLADNDLMTELAGKRLNIIIEGNNVTLRNICIIKTYFIRIGYFTTLTLQNINFDNMILNFKYSDASFDDCIYNGIFVQNILQYTTSSDSTSQYVALYGYAWGQYHLKNCKFNLYIKDLQPSNYYSCQASNPYIGLIGHFDSGLSASNGSSVVRGYLNVGIINNIEGCRFNIIYIAGNNNDGCLYPLFNSWCQQQYYFNRCEFFINYKNVVGYRSSSSSPNNLIIGSENYENKGYNSTSYTYNYGYKLSTLNSTTNNMCFTNSFIIGEINLLEKAYSYLGCAGSYNGNYKVYLLPCCENSYASVAIKRQNSFTESNYSNIGDCGYSKNVGTNLVDYTVLYKDYNSSHTFDADGFTSSNLTHVSHDELTNPSVLNETYDFFVLDLDEVDTESEESSE